MGPGMAALRNVLNFKEIHRLLSGSSNNLRFKHSTRAFASAKPPSSVFAALDTFPQRHIGPDDHEASHMLSTLGYDSMDAFVGAAVPSKIRVPSNAVSTKSIPALSESELYHKAKALGGCNKLFKSYIGMGYHNAVVPPVILRNASLNLLRLAPS
jgi:glycine dehydrogenase